MKNLLCRLTALVFDSGGAALGKAANRRPSGTHPA